MHSTTSTHDYTSKVQLKGEKVFQPRISGLADGATQDATNCQSRDTKALDATLQSTKPLKSESPDGPRWWFMATCAAITGLYAGYFAFFDPPGDPTVKARIMSNPAGIAHIVGGGLGMLIGPIQFLKSIRYKQIGVHIWVGRIYAVAILFSGIGAFRVSAYAICYTVGKAGFAILAAVWLYTLTVGMNAIWKGDVAKHRRWLLRNYALTYAAVMLRWQLPLLIILGGIDATMALTITSVSSWLPNLIFVEWWLRRMSPPKITY